MAFEPSTKGFACGKCGDPFTYHKLMVSSQGAEDGRVCVSCELGIRQCQWKKMSPEQQAKEPTFCAKETVQRDLKRQNKAGLIISRCDSKKQV